MKTNVSHSDSQKAVKSEAAKQASAETILQAYKRGTSQLQATEEEPMQRKENKTGLPDNLKSGVENLSGLSMDDVKVHYGSSKPAELQAHAYAQGTDIHVAPGQEKHLPHEAWHVAQQKQGRVKPTMQMKGTIPVNDNAGLEKEADVMGAKAIQLKDKNAAQKRSVGNNGGHTIQRAAIPADLKEHKDNLDEVTKDISAVKDKNSKTDQPLKDTIEGSDTWASETKFAAKRKYAEYFRASNALTRNATDVKLGEDTLVNSDVEYNENGKKHNEESKVVSGDWPQFSVNVLAAREQAAIRTDTGGVGIASITLTNEFYTNAKKTLRTDQAGVIARCKKYLTSTMRKKYDSNQNTQFIVRVFFDPTKNDAYEDFDVTKWHP